MNIRKELGQQNLRCTVFQDIRVRATKLAKSRCNQAEQMRPVQGMQVNSYENAS